MTNINKLQDIIDQAEAENDIDTLRRLLSEGFEKAPEAPRAFAAQMQMREDFSATYFEGGVEGGFAVNWLNKIARAERRVAFNLKTLGGFNGLILAEEGDSWTQYPVLLKDIVDQLDQDDDVAIYSTGAAGDIVANMAHQKDYLKALSRSGARGMILSGGGNDLLGDGALEKVLLPFEPGKAPEDLLDQDALSHILGAVIGHFRTILSDIAAADPGVRVFGHGYDLPYPADGGKWLGKPLQRCGIPLDVGREVIRVIIDLFNTSLNGLQSEKTNFVYTDLRGKVGLGPNSWFDELHPRNAGYARAATALRATIDAHMAGGIEMSAGTAEPSTFGMETTQGAMIVLDPGHGGTTTVGGSRPNNAFGPAGTLEKTMTLDIARRTRTVLEGRGFKVRMTRDSDVNLGLKARASVARAIQAPVFVSIHFNGFNGAVQGTETFVHNQGSAASRRLCRAVQAEMVDALVHADRNASHGGVKVAGFGVLRPEHHDDTTAAVLHEVSFMDVADEEHRLLKVSYRQKIAAALADGIEGYLSANLLGVEMLMDEADVGDGFELAEQSLHETAVDQDVLGGSHLLSTPTLAPVSVLEPQAWLRMAAEQLASPISPDDMNDVDEFATLGRGEALDLGTFGGNAEANFSRLQSYFGGVESTGFNYDAFDAFVAGLGLRHFNPIEFLEMGGSNNAGTCKGLNSLPPQSLWPNLANVARMIDEIRDRLGASVHITSCYRSDAYNLCVGGKSGSLHKRFNAIDWYCSSGSVQQWHQVAKQVRTSNPAFQGGIGLYVSRNFVHIDTRGNEANWSKP